MEIRYNVTGAQRKELVKTIADATGAKAKYMGMPTAAYEIDYFTGSDDSCDAYSLEKQILKLEEESEHLMELMGSTSGDTDRFLNEIKNNFEQVKILQEKLQIAKISAEADLTINSEFERLEKMFADTDVSFNEYDDVIVRRLIECIRVLKENKIIVILKGGFQVEEYIV